MEREEIISLFYFPSPVDIRENVVEFGDSQTIIDHKRKYPLKLYNSLTFCVQTTKRNFSLFIEKNFCWNGADIPKPFWWLIGSRTDNQFMLASLIHDFMLNRKFSIISENLNSNISLDEYRNLTSLIFREVLLNVGVNKMKAYVMSYFVDLWQRHVFEGIKNKNG